MNRIQQQYFPGARALSLLAAAAFVVVLAGCGDKKGETASQTAAKVNKEEITVHQINFVLQRQQGLKPEQAEAAGRQVLERLIDQELAVQKAQDQKLDRDPRVVQQIEAAKREIIARAYVEKVGETITKPTDAEISAYYNEKPNLFKDRRIYSLQELQIEAQPQQVQDLRAKLGAVKSIAEYVEFLKSGGYHFSGNQAVRAAEQLPMSSLDNIARMKDNDSAFTQTPTGATVLFLAGSRSQPVDEAHAKPAIDAFLSNQRKAEAVQKDIKALRAAGKIEYVGKFAQAASAPAGASSPAPVEAPPAATAEPASTAASGLDSSAISKGMGLK